MQQLQPARYEEDEIDLRELFRTLAKKKKFIAVFTLAVTILAVAYVLVATPKYEVKANVQVGFMQDEKGKKTLVDNPGSMVQLLKVIFRVDDKEKVEKFVSEVSSISANKKVKDFITIKTLAISNEEALKKNKEVVSYLQKKYEPRIEQYLLNQQNKIEKTLETLERVKNFEIVQAKQKIKELKTQKIANIDAKIDFYTTAVIPSIEKRIANHKANLKKYNSAIEKLYGDANKADSSTKAIISVQMVNYQNLILNSQNEIQDLLVQKEQIKKEVILDLQNQKENVLDKEVWALEHKLNVELPNKVRFLKEQIKALKYSVSETNVKNTQVVGKYVVLDHPIKPKKKLVVVVAFITGLILSVFLVFFMEFIRGFKEEQEQLAE